jgi:tetratricopeptide (TPR) repeat protein
MARKKASKNDPSKATKKGRQQRASKSPVGRVAKGPKSSVNSDSSKYLPPLVLFLISLVLYANTAFHEYAVDDYIIVQENEYVKKGLDGLSDIFTSDAFEGYYGERGKSLVAGGRYRPLSIATFALEKQILGELKPHFSHQVNILLFAITVALIFLTLKRLIPPRKGAVWASIAFLGALFYATHPIHTEAVANIKGRDEIMGFGFAIASLLFLLRYVDESDLKWLGVSIFLYACALFSKENAITFLAVMPAGLFLLKKKSPLDSVKPVLPHIALALVFLMLRQKYAGSGSGIFELMNNPFLFSSTSERIGTVMLTYIEYARLLVFPHPLSHDYYPYQIPVVGLGNPMALLGFLLTLGFVTITVYAIYKRRYPVLGFALAYFIFTFSVGSNLLFQIGTNMNERFLFMPSLGFTIALAWLLLKFKQKFPGKAQFGLPVSLLIFILIVNVGFGLKTIDRNSDWKNNLTLFAADVKNSPNSAKVHLSYANSLVKHVTENLQMPKNEKDSILNLAISHLQTAVEIYPETAVLVNGKPKPVGYADAWACMGDAYFLKSRFDSAEIAYLNAHAVRDKHFNAFIGLSLTMLNTDQYHRAVYYLKSVLTVDNQNYQHWERLGDAYFNLGLEKKEENANLSPTGIDSASIFSELSITSFLQAMNLNQAGQANYQYEIGRNYARLQDDFNTAITHFRNALVLKPDMVPAREDLGISLMLTGQFEAAVNNFRVILDGDPNNLNARLNLGFTQLQAALNRKASGDLQEAMAFAQSCIETYSPIPPENTQAFIQARLGMGRAQAEVLAGFDQAAFRFDEALQLDSGLMGAISGFAVEANQRGDLSALQFYQNYITSRSQ